MTARTHKKEGEAFASLSNASKFYGSFAALKNVSIKLTCGEVHMLLGENGAGKSTLVSLLTGTNRLDEGVRTLCGAECPNLTPLEAREAGINTVLQDFGLAPTLTAVENFALGREKTKGGLLVKAEMRADMIRAMQRLGVSIDPDARVDTLTRAEQQLLEIVRALGGKPGALILDEPTATLSHDESEHLFSAVELLRSEGWAILYISHRMEEIRRLGDVVTILRDGRFVGCHRLANVTNDQMITEMVGREMSNFYPEIPHKPAAVALEVKGLSSGKRVKDVSLAVRAGEIVGIGGLVGCGKAEVARAIFGLQPVDEGEIIVAGARVHKPTPAGMLECGLIYLPQDRRGEALALNRSIAENIVMEVLSEKRSTTAGFVRTSLLGGLVSDVMKRLKVQPAEPNKPVQELSGGNQQKVVLGRALSRDRKVFIFDEPTAGIDVGARLDFYNQLQRLCADGAAILFISSDLQELVHLSHRIYVMHEGHCTAELGRDEITEERVIAYAFGEKPKEDIQ